MRVIRVRLGQERQYDATVFGSVEAVDEGDVLVRELKVEHVGVLLDPLWLRRLGHDCDAPLNVPPQQNLWDQ